jgi:hypothetical protein
MDRLSHALFSNHPVAFGGEIDVFFGSLLRLLLEGMQHINSGFELRNVEYALCTFQTDTYLVNAFAYRWHRFEISWHDTQLHT